MLAEGTRIGRYEVVAVLGVGGMGEVYRVRDLRLGREVALKVIAHGALADSRAVARFEQEARLAGALDHPNVLAVHDVGDHDGRPFLVCELLDGQTLRELLATGPLPADRAVEIGAEIARGLAAAHDKGIVHRDLKPENVFITADGRVKVFDFGIAKLLPDGSGSTVTDGIDQAPHTRTGAVIGTLAYMSPEQIRGEPVDARSDVFSLGCVLHEMLAGERPFRGRTPMEAAAAILSHPAPPLPAAVPRAVDAVVRRCLDKPAAARFASAGEVASALAAAAGEPAGQPATHAAPWKRRIGLGALSVTAGVAALVAWQASTRRSARQPEPAAHGPSIAVLPFADLSPGKDQEYFSDGLAEELLNALAHVDGLRVAGRTSSFSFKGKNEDVRTIAQKLNVAHLLEGSVRKAGARVRVTAQLIAAADGFHLWSQTYDRDLTDVFAVQDDISRSVVEALRLKLVPGRKSPTDSHRTANPEVYALYLAGKQLEGRHSQPSARRAVELFQGALALDPAYAPALAGLAHALTVRADDAPTPDAMAADQRRAVVAADKAIELDPQLAEAFAARAYLRVTQVWDWSGARSDIERALELSPGDARAKYIHGYLLAALGQSGLAIPVLDQAVQLNPLDSSAWGLLARLHLGAGHLDAARRAAERQSAAAPESGAVCRLRASLFEREGRLQDALAACSVCPEPLWKLFCTVRVDHALGHERESKEALDAMIAQFGDVAPFQVAVSFAERGEADGAFAWLDRAYQRRDRGMANLKISAALVAMRTDPRYAALLRKMNLPPD